MTRAQAKTLLWVSDFGFSIVFYIVIMVIVQILSLLFGFSTILPMSWVIVILALIIGTSAFSATRFVNSDEAEEYIEYLING